MNGADIHSLHDFLNTDCLVIEPIFKITNWQSQNDFSWPVSFASWWGGGEENINGSSQMPLTTLAHRSP